MPCRRFFAAPVLVLLVAGCGNHDQAMEEIIRLEDRRAPAAALEKFLVSRNSAVQRRAVIALGRMQDAEAVPLLVPLLEISDAATRVAAVFALGQLSQPQTTHLLLQRYPKEKDLEVRLALIEAVSKTADDSMMSAVNAALLNWFSDQIPIVRAEAALAAARLAHRGLKKMDWGVPLAKLLNDKDEEARWRAAYALMRLYSGGQTAPDSTTVQNLIAALKDRSTRVRMQAGRALGAMKSAAALEALTDAGKNDADWRVRVNANSALGNLETPDLPTRLALADSNMHVRIAALRALGTATERMRRSGVLQNAAAQIAFLRERLHARGTWQEQFNAATALAAISREAAIPDLAALMEHENAYFRSRIAEALGITAAAEAFVYLEKMSRDSATIVQIAALEALPKLPATVRAKATPIYLEALQRGDAVVTAVAAENLAADSLQRKSHAAAILAAYQKLRSPVDAEAAQMIFAALAQCGDLSAKPLLEEAVKFPDKPFARYAAEALKKLTGEDYSGQVPKETKPTQEFSYTDIQRLAGAAAMIETNKGNIEIKFYPDDAPLTVLNFVRLAQKGFFDGLLIHRVVPNFVIQTGDPRGDQWGSPGYAIRSEFSRRRYTAGVVGMASAGPDTEGSQFFITHSDQPHLDGKYTIFGRVKTGMEVVEALQVGDRMENVTIRF
ncbi:MAG: peptidylprolyl isomerase [candidate division KSB1 bacterium]|nr:peptidylprolyl isomerase [candidate division KSB1 bacterium]MDZ7364702.1 peptidylprolyl isomerase [candidate division KSB1 bacterium]MDZ7402550.1 peptidylprolyl isomerase [candidate division KSB1 bacterium]